MKTISKHLREAGIPDDLFHLLNIIARTAKYVYHGMQEGDLGKAGTQNVFGEDQLALDVFANRMFVEELTESRYCSVLASEELDDVCVVPDDLKGKYAVAFDPLDGSSLVNVNFAVGSIFGIFESDKFVGLKGRDQIASIIIMYGPRMSLFYSVGKGVHEFVQNSVGEFVLSNENIKVSPDGKVFAPGNLRATAKNEKYREVMDYWMKEQYKLRYSGGMVPDVNHILLKGKGIFTYPGYEDQPLGKLRLLFECAPMAYLIEQAGGRATNGEKPILDLEIESLDQRTPILIGSENEVKKVEEILSK